MGRALPLHAVAPWMAARAARMEVICMVMD
jgi:hypothetical protein